MNKHLRADVSFAWPTAEIAVMGAEGAVNVVFRKEIEKATDPEAGEPIEEYRAKFSTPYAAAERGFIDDATSRPRRGPSIKAPDAVHETRDDPRAQARNIPLGRHGARMNGHRA